MNEQHATSGAETRWRTASRLTVLVVAVTLLVALAALASRPGSDPGGPATANAGPVIAIVHLVQIGAITIALLGLLLMIALFVLARRRRQDEEEEDRLFVEPARVHWAIRLLIAALPFLTLAAVIYSLARSGRTLQLPVFAPIAGNSPPPGGGEFAEQVSANAGLGWWEVAIAVALAGLVVAVVVRAFRQPEPESGPWLPTEADTSGRAFATAITAGLRDARLERDPRRAVIAAYATMERLLAAEGLPRQETEAPLEYLTRLSGKLPLNREALRTLTGLFARARFSQHEISSANREQAIAALVVIEQELRAAP